MRETIVIIKSWCNFCAAEDKRVEATEAFSVAIDRGEQGRSKARLVDTCDEHGSMLEFVRVVTLGGVTGGERRTPQVKASNESRGTKVCKLCDAEVKYLVPHIRTVHCAGATTPPQPKVCPDCGHVTEPGGMTPHRSRAHGWTAVGEYYALAQRIAERQTELPILDPS